MTTRPPDQFQPWDNSRLPAEACNPYDFGEVLVWKDGTTTSVKPSELPPSTNVAGWFWRPIPKHH